MKLKFIGILGISLVMCACTSTVVYSTHPTSKATEKSRLNDAEWTDMTASFYGEQHHGRMTANGETFDMYAMTCAHKTLDFGTVLLILNPDNNKTVEVKVNDRGPFIEGRDLDLSWGAAKKLDIINDGVKTLKVKKK